MVFSFPICCAHYLSSVLGYSLNADSKNQDAGETSMPLRFFKSSEILKEIILPFSFSSKSSNSHATSRGAAWGSTGECTKPAQLSPAHHSGSEGPDFVQHSIHEGTLGSLTVPLDSPGYIATIPHSRI